MKIENKSKMLKNDAFQGFSSNTPNSRMKRRIHFQTSFSVLLWHKIRSFFSIFTKFDEKRNFTELYNGYLA